jgi:hypothetical protein
MRYIDTKYRVEGSIHKYDGTLVPDDEPLFLFRAQDKLTPKVLAYYRSLRVEMGDTDELLTRMDEQIDKIVQWQKSHYTQMPQ